MLFHCLLGLLLERVGQLLLAMADILPDCEDSEILEHSLSFLSVLVSSHLPSVDNQCDAVTKLKDVLIKKSTTLSSVENKVGVR